MKKLLATILLKIGGWKQEYPKNFQNQKCVFISAPHTSKLDYVYAIASYWSQGLDASVLCEKGEIIPVFKYFVNKIRKNNYCVLDKFSVDFLINVLKEKQNIQLIVPIKCGLGRVEKWRTEFYDIAYKANVPIALGYIDYADKLLGVRTLFEATGDKYSDLKKIENFYKNFTPSNLNNYNSKIF